MHAMKNVTFSIPDDLLEKSRNYAETQGKTLNEMTRKDPRNRGVFIISTIK